MYCINHCESDVLLHLLFFFKVFNGFLLNGLESFISEKERLEGKAPGFDADGERGAGQGAKWDIKQCSCARAKLENAPVIGDAGNASCFSVNTE